MLEFIRKNVVGAVGFIIVGALVFVFAVGFGSQSQGWCKGQALKFAATVQGRDITENVVKYGTRLSGGGDVNLDDASSAALKLRVLDGLVERELLVSLAENAGITASVDEAETRIIHNELYLTNSLDYVDERIGSNPFYPPTVLSRALIKEGHRVRTRFVDEDGRFDLDGYTRFIRNYLQVTEHFFVEQQRLELIAQRMRELLVSAVRVSDEEVRDAYLRENDTATIDYIKLSPGYYSDNLKPTPDQLTAWAAEHADEVKQYYEANKFQYTNLEKKVRAQHVLIKTERDADEAAKAEARKRIEKVLADARRGVDFAELARQFSEDPGSKAKGGDLGYAPRGRMVPEFDDALFATKPGEISDIVETKYGFHVIKVLDIREGDVSLDAATPEIADILYRRSEGSAAAKKAGEQYLARIKGGALISSLIPVPAEDAPPAPMAPQVRTSRAFSRSAKSVPGIGEATDVVSAVFELSTAAPLAEQIFEVRGDYYLVQLKERNEPSDSDFEEKEVELTESLLALKRSSVLKQRMAEFMREAEESGAIERQIYAVQPPATPAQPPVSPAGDTPLGPAGKAGKTDVTPSKPAEGAEQS